MPSFIDAQSSARLNGDLRRSICRHFRNTTVFRDLSCHADSLFVVFNLRPAKLAPVAAPDHYGEDLIRVWLVQVDRVDFEVLEDIKVKDVIVVPRGGLALATIAEAEHKRRMARGGKLNVNIDDVRLADGEKAPLRAVKETQGGGHTGAMTGAIVATAIVFFPAAPVFLFMHGKDITIPKGTEITAYVNGDIPLEPKRFVAQVTASPETGAAPVPATAKLTQTQNGSAPDPVLSTVDLKSTPDGAEITVDEKFMGSTPSSLRLAVGGHKIRLGKPGFKTWERTMTVGAGATATVDATLEKQE